MRAATRAAKAERALPLLSWLIASCASAAIVHALIGAAGSAGIGGDAYADHDHGAVGPVALAAVTLAATLLLAAAARVALGRGANDPLVSLARRFATIDPVVPCCAVALGAFATLAGMELGEQACAFGRISGLGDALGGDIVFGSIALAGTAAFVTLGLLRSARALVETTLAAATVVAAWLSKDRAESLDPALLARPASKALGTSSGLLARSGGLRAPPLPV